MYSAVTLLALVIPVVLGAPGLFPPRVLFSGLHYHSKAERQKARSEQQAAAQNSSKRSHIDFTKGPGKDRDKNTERHSRFEPYASGGKEKQRNWWGWCRLVYLMS